LGGEEEELDLAHGMRAEATYLAIVIYVIVSREMV
jgi:hypothetical protein